MAPSIRIPLTAPTLCLSLFALVVPACSVELDIGDGGVDLDSVDDDDSEAEEGSESTTLDSESTDTGGSSGGETSGSTGAPPSCVDACQPELTAPCSEDGTQFVECMTGEDGCYHYAVTACDDDALCILEPGCVTLVASCAEILAQDPGAVDGVYAIDVDGPGGLAPVEVVCDMTTDGGGWTLITFNDETTTFVEFDRSWQDYKGGFGDLTSGDLGWLGNDRIHTLTDGGVELQVRHNHPWVNVYADFSVGDEASLYPLTVSTTPDSLDGGWFADFHSGLPFSTFDNENDTHAALNCADDRRAGWWYASCFAVSIASSGSPAPMESQVYWRPPPPMDAAPLWVEWIAMWIR